MYNAFSKKSSLKNRAITGIVFSFFVLANVLLSFPAQFAHAANLAEVKVAGRAEDASKTTLAAGDQFIIALDYRASWDDLVIDTAGSCTVNGKDVKNTFQNFGDGTFQLVYTVAQGDANAAAGQIPFSCALKDTAGNMGTVTGFTEANTIAVSAGGTTGGNTNTGGDTTTGGNTNTGGDTTGGTNTGGDTTTGGNTNTGGDTTTGGNTNTGGDTTTGGNTNTGGDNNGLPPAGTFTTTVEPNTGTMSAGDMLIIRVNDRGGVVDFAVDPAGVCTVNGKNVKDSFQAFGDHTYQVVYTVAAGDASVAAGQLAISCDLKNPAGTTAKVSSFTDSNTVVISGATTGGDTNTGGNTNTGTTTDTTGGTNTNTGTTTNPTGGNTNTSTTTDTTTGGNTNTGGDTTTGGNTNTDGTVGGDVTGGANSNTNGTLAITSIEQVRGTAIADGTMENGWRWIFNVTVPSNETSVQLKFGNWTHTNGINSISPANNMRFYSNQAVSSSPVMISGADAYSSAIEISGDLDSTAAGKQVEIVVEMGVPVGSTNGAYSTSYGIKSTE